MWVTVGSRFGAVHVPSRSRDSEPQSCPFFRRPVFRCTVDKTGDSMRKLKALDYMCGLGVMIAGLGLYSYYVRELLAP